MFQNYLKFAWRVLTKNKFYSFLNILGLALGIACSLIILLYLQDDLTYDTHHRKQERIYRVVSYFNIAGKDDQFAVTSPVLGHMMQEEYPEVIENVVRFQTGQKRLVKFGDRTFYEENFVYGDSTVFDVFTHQFIAGDPHTSLREKNSIVLTEKIADRYFGKENPLGKLIDLDGSLIKVTGVIKNVPSNSHLKYDALVSYTTQEQGPPPNPQQRRDQLWGLADYTYILCKPNGSAADIEKKFPAFYNKYMSELGKKLSGKFKPGFQPLADVHFNQANLQYDRPVGNRAYIYAFSVIGLFILTLAAINYTNLATARSVSRAKEIGMRKVVGTSRESLITQFLGESIFLAFVSLGFALLMVTFVFRLTPFNQLIEKNLQLDFIHNPILLFGSLGVTLLIGLLASGYPAFYLSSIPTLAALKGTLKAGASGLTLRKVLVAFQFTISIGILICTLLMNRQIDFLRNKELGFHKENVLLIDIQDTLIRNQINYIKAELLKNPNVLAATTANMIPGEGLGKNLMQAEGKNGMESGTFNLMFVGEDYIQTMGMKIIQGRDFDKSRPADLNSAIVINETAAKYLGWDKPLNKKMTNGGDQEFRVIGVVKDFNTHSLHEPIGPMVMVRNPRNGGTLHLRLSGENLPRTLDFIRSKWSTFDPKRPFEYRFLDASFNKLYASDERQSQLIGVLSYLCAFISCLGLLGLSSFTISQRTKEIGIRKVLGASAGSIVYLLFKDILVLIVLACLVASPLAYMLIRKWLEEFAYQVNIHPLVFPMAGLAALTFAFITVSFHSLRAAQANPVKALKYE